MRDPAAESDRAIRLATGAMGTRFEIVIDLEAAESITRDVAFAAGEEALREIELWHARLSPFEPASLVSRVHREGHERAVILDHETFELLVLAEQIRDRSRGAFDICVGHLMLAHGFRGVGDAQPRPENAVVVGTPHERVRPTLILEQATRSVRICGREARIDLGAIAKGWALDRAAEVLRESGVASAFLHAGTSSALAMGPRSWNVGIAGVDCVHGSVMGTIALHDAALSISALDGQYVERGGHRLGHEMDPRTGAPARGSRLAACVVEARVPSVAALADGWSTALIVGGPGLLGAVPDGLQAWIETDAGPCATLGWQAWDAAHARPGQVEEGGRCVGPANRSS